MDINKIKEMISSTDDDVFNLGIQSLLSYDIHSLGNSTRILISLYNYMKDFDLSMMSRIDPVVINDITIMYNDLIKIIKKKMR